jgi:hypothetical protein
MPSLATLNGQFVGFVRGGKRYVYGSYFPKLTEREKRDSARMDTLMRAWGKPNPMDWHEQPMRICHGSIHFFSVEYSLEARKIEQLYFDGGEPGEHPSNAAKTPGDTPAPRN